MSKEAWGTGKVNTSSEPLQKAEKKNAAFWEAANENVMIIPDIDAET